MDPRQTLNPLTFFFCLGLLSFTQLALAIPLWDEVDHYQGGASNPLVIFGCKNEIELPAEGRCAELPDSAISPVLGIGGISDPQINIEYVPAKPDAALRNKYGAVFLRCPEKYRASIYKSGMFPGQRSQVVCIPNQRSNDRGELPAVSLFSGWFSCGNAFEITSMSGIYTPSADPVEYQLFCLPASWNDK
jgi:hypothetical protein